LLQKAAGRSSKSENEKTHVLLEALVFLLDTTRERTHTVPVAVAWTAILYPFTSAQQAKVARSEEAVHEEKSERSR